MVGISERRSGAFGEPRRIRRLAGDKIWRAGPVPHCAVRRATAPMSASVDSGGGQGASPAAELPPLILVIDDDEMVRIVLEQILDDAGYRVALAVDGRAGMAMAMERTPDLIITDIIMPEMDGLDVIRSLMRAENAPPIIAISGGTRLNDRIRLSAPWHWGLPRPAKSHSIPMTSWRWFAPTPGGRGVARRHKGQTAITRRHLDATFAKIISEHCSLNPEG